MKILMIPKKRVQKMKITVKLTQPQVDALLDAAAFVQIAADYRHPRVPLQVPLSKIALQVLGRAQDAIMEAAHQQEFRERSVNTAS